MSKFTYTAKSTDGQTLTSVLEAASKKTVIDALHEKGLVVVRVEPVKPSQGLRRRGGVKVADMAMFSRQLATLVDAGIPIVSGLDALSEQAENRRMSEVVSRVQHDVEGGTGLTAAIAKEKETFSPLFVSMIRAGESSGHLADVLERLATYLEKNAAFHRKIQSACVYPALVIAMAVGVTVILMVKVVPMFQQIFSDFGAVLPLPTQILIQISALMKQYFWFGLGGLLLGTHFLRRFLETPRGRSLYDRMLLKLPVVGLLTRKTAIARFSRTLSTLTQSGVHLLSSLEIVAESAGNRVVQDAVDTARHAVQEGASLADPLAESGVFPPLVIRMIVVGEQTGRLEQMLTKVAEFYEDQVDTAIQGLTSAIEPIIISVVGLLIGGIVLSIFLPLFSLAEAIFT